MNCLEITSCSFCKLACKYCSQVLLLKQYGKLEYMSYETFQICINKVPKDTIISFAGYAEPFLNNDVAKMIKLSIEKGYETALYTTLQGIRKEDIDLISGLKFNHISLHLPDKEKYMNAKVDNEYVANAVYFKSKVGYTSAHCYGTCYDELNNLFNVERRELRNLHTRANNVDITKIDLQYKPRILGKIQCGVVLRRNNGNHSLNFNVLLPNGNVNLCCMDYGLEHTIGNLLTDSYESLFQSPEYLRIQAGLLDDSIDILCRTCSEAVNV